MLPKIAILIATGLAQAHGAAIAAHNASSHALLHTKVLSSGTLRYWGLPSPEDATRDWDAGWGEPADGFELPRPAIQRRCGGNVIHCADSNLAHSDVCEALVTVLRNHPRVDVADNVRGLVFSAGSLSCCVSWHDYVGNMVQGYLTDAAAKTLGTCGPGGTISGYASEVSLNNICTTQCLSTASSCF